TPFTLTSGLRYDLFIFIAASILIASHCQLNPIICGICDITDNFSLLANLNQAWREPRLNEAMFANELCGAAADFYIILKAET
ncbi:TonB-dependent receptor, partial [Neisseria sp. P0001.S008]